MPQSWILLLHAISVDASYLLGKSSRVVEGELEYARHQDHDGAHDVHPVLLPSPRGEPDTMAMVTATRVFFED